MTKLMRLSFLFLLFLSLPITGECQARNLPGGGEAPAEQYQILVLDAYPRGLPIPESINRGILAALREKGFSVGDVFIEHLDFARTPTSEHRSNIVKLLRHKLAEKHITMVISIGAPATDFMAREGKKLFPAAAVLSIISPNHQILSRSYARAINIPWRVDPAGTLRVALGLYPKTQRVFVVTGANDNILPFLDFAKKEFSAWQGTLEFEYSNEMTYGQMLRRIAALPKETIVIYSPFFTDTTGRTFVPAEVVAKVCEVANAPVFATLEEYLGLGIIGGSLLRTEDVGRRAGTAAFNYLHGHLRLVAPVTTLEATPLIEFDWRTLTHWKADKSKLPQESIFINRPLTLWGQYKTQVITAAAAFLLLTVLLFALLLLNRRLKRAKEVATQSEERFRVMIERAPEAIIIYDIDLKLIVDANSKAEQFFGCRREELLQGGPERFYSADQPDHEAAAESMEEVNSRAMAGEELVFERSIHSADGTKRTCEVRVVQLPYRDKKLLRGSFIDITERKQALEDLHETRSMLQAAMDQSPAGIAIADAPDGKLRYVNAAGLFLRGNDRVSSEIDGGAEHNMGSWQLLDLDGRPLKTDEVPLTRAIMFGESCNREFIARRANNDDHIVLGKAAPIRNKAGEIVAGIIVLDDITERKRTELELRRHKENLDALVAERTADLHKSLRLMSGREIRMAELKVVIKKLRAQLLEAGINPIENDPLDPKQ